MKASNADWTREALFKERDELVDGPVRVQMPANLATFHSGLPGHASG